MHEGLRHHKYASTAESLIGIVESLTGKNLAPQTTGAWRSTFRTMEQGYFSHTRTQPAYRGITSSKSN